MEHWAEKENVDGDMVRSVAEIHNAPGLGQGIGVGGRLDRCWGRACIYTRSASPDSSSVFGLCVVVVFFLYFLFFFISSAVHLCPRRHRGGSPECFNHLFHHLNEIIAENPCALFFLFCVVLCFQLCEILISLISSPHYIKIVIN